MEGTNTEFRDDWIQSREFDLRLMVESKVSGIFEYDSEKSLSCIFDKELPETLVGPQKAIGELVAVTLAYTWERLYRGELEVEVRCTEANEFTVDVEISFNSRLTKWSRFDPIAQQCRFRNAEDDGSSVKRMEALCNLLGVRLQFEMGPLGERILARGFKLSYPTSIYGKIVGKRVSNLSGKTLLFVEDNVLYRSVLEKHFERWGMRVEAMNDAEAAIQLIEEGAQFDYGVYDINLPGLSGLELAAYCRNDERIGNMRIVSLSGIPRKSGEPFFDANLIKPVVPEVLRRTLSDLHPDQN